MTDDRQPRLAKCAEHRVTHCHVCRWYDGYSEGEKAATERIVALIEAQIDEELSMLMDEETPEDDEVLWASRMASLEDLLTAIREGES